MIIHDGTWVIPPSALGRKYITSPRLSSTPPTTHHLQVSPTSLLRTPHSPPPSNRLPHPTLARCKFLLTFFFLAHPSPYMSIDIINYPESSLQHADPKASPPPALGMSVSKVAVSALRRLWIIIITRRYLSTAPCSKSIFSCYIPKYLTSASLLDPNSHNPLFALVVSNATSSFRQRSTPRENKLAGNGNTGIRKNHGMPLQAQACRRLQYL